jgi:hypothetical protein
VKYLLVFISAGITDVFWTRYILEAGAKRAAQGAVLPFRRGGGR